MRKEKDAVTLLFGFSPLLGTFLIDIIVHNILKNYSFPYITSIGWQLVIVSLLFILANRFVKSRRQVEELNRTLENKVEERTKELSDSNSKLSEANNQLELTNNQLTEAKRKADRDLKLAANVQNSFFNPSLPHFKNWDLVYTFKPAAGVSGDLYDFFHDGEDLKGLGLFDVSGHGIASGLVTMLAKTIIDRKFREGAELPFSRVMSEIDKQINEEKGDIENYLTGVLLRIQGNQVELINAGHPKVFIRTAKNGKCYPVEAKEGNDKNGIIGFGGMKQEYKALKFKMQKGDSIILYTDCLNESVNKEGEQFSEERIATAFEDAGMKPNEVQYYNAHGTSTSANDSAETAMIKAVFGEDAKKLHISSTKSEIGHMVGAAGAIEAIMCIKAMEDDFVPPTINLDEPDLEHGCDLDYTPNKGVSCEIKASASCSLGFGGHNGCVILKKLND